MIIYFICLADGVSVCELSTNTNKLKKKKKRSKSNSICGSSCSYDVPGPLDAGGLRWEREDSDNIEKEREGKEVRKEERGWWTEREGKEVRKEERGWWTEKARGGIWGIKDDVREKYESWQRFDARTLENNWRRETRESKESGKNSE